MSISAYLFTPVRFLMLCFFLFISIVSVQSQTKGEYQGLLWEITGPNLKKPSYLYGTMHVSNRIAFHLSDTFFVALKNSDMVALEINPETLVEDFLNSPYFAESKRLMGYSDDDFYREAFALNKPEKEGIARLLAQDSDFANYLLYRSERQKENFEEETYLDMFIFQAGKKLNKKVLGLEDINVTMELSLKANQIGEEDHTDRVSYTDRMEVYSKIEDAYRKGDLDLIDSLGHISYSKNYRKYMLDVRNEIMAVRMDSVIQSGTSLFTGVGAAHLPGDNGVISLLREMGYKLRPVTHTEDRSMKMKDKIDKTLYKFSSIPQTMEDSLFQVETPARLLSSSSLFSDAYSMSGVSSYREYFCPEVVNGAYYSVFRINTFGPLYGLKQEDMFRTVDSILFENIPGKIIKKKETEENGNPAFEIVSRTRKGDLNHFKIIVTPLEVLILKVSGSKDFMDKESGKFVKSLKFNQKDSEQWSRYSSPSGNFTVSMPGLMLKEISRENNTRKLLLQSYTGDKDYYLCMKAVLHDYEYIEEDSFELEHLAEMFYSQFDYEVEEKRFFILDGKPALDVVLKKDSQMLRVRIAISATDYYLIASTAGDENWNRFSGSFHLSGFRYIASFEEYTDSLSYFKVTTPVKPVGHAFLRKELIEVMSGRKANEAYRADSRSYSFVNDATDEIIKVDYYKFHDFKGYRNLSEMWEEELEDLNGNGSLIVADKEIPDEHRMNLLLTDTSSVRAIKVHLYWKEGALFKVYANIDTVSGESKFVKTFFDTFTPLDTLHGVSVLADKPEMFFSALAGEDSVKAVNALNSISVIRFRDEHAERLIKIIENYPFSRMVENYSYTKQQMISELGNLKHEAIIPFLEKQYKNAGDTSAYQIVVLNALVKLKTRDSYKSIGELMQEDVPLTRESEISSLFSGFQDSLELAKILYPDMMEYTRYQEYKSGVYRLLYSLVDSGYLNPQDYVAFKREILREANEEVKRKAAKEVSSATSSYSYYYDYSSSRNKRADILEVYSGLLIPFYEEKAVNTFFTNLRRIKDAGLNLQVSLLMLKNNKEVADSVFSEYSSIDGYRLTLYNGLKNIGKLEKFDPVYKSQEAICKALLYDNILTSEKDSAVLIERRIVEHNGKEGYIYFFKSKKEDDDVWELDFIGLQPSDTSQVEFEDILIVDTGTMLPEENIEEVIDEQVEQISLMGRKRVKPDYRNAHDYSDFIDY